MKRIFNISKKIAVAVVVLFGTLLSSCTDYLTIIPPDKVIEEHYWQTKDDVNGVLATAYLKLLEKPAVDRAIVWGELRAYGLTYNETFSGGEWEDLKDVIEANIEDENRYCDWSRYYEAIQNANLVIARAPQVVERDPDFTESDLNIVLGEMYALRALGHFYLVRAFRDIPMALEAVIGDYDMPKYKQVHPLEALNYIMEDLETAETLVMKSGGYGNVASNVGRITENAVLAMKADVSLWRAAFATYYKDNSELVATGDVEQYYNDCIAYCQQVSDNMDQLYEEEMEKTNSDYEKFPFNLLQNEGENSMLKNGLSTAYVETFGTGNSRESILELQVEINLAENKNFSHALPGLYGSQGGKGLLVVPNNFVDKFYKKKNDLRAYNYTTFYKESSESEAVPTVYVAKYVAKSSPAAEFRESGRYDANWIVYRKTDVLLMMAEALVLRESSTTEDFEQAFEIVNAIYTRSVIDPTKDKLMPNSYIGSRESMHKLVREERVRELVFEGKIWFDLVRKALCDGNTSGILDVTERLASGPTVAIKMASIDALFMPIHEDELRFNKDLIQNPAYKNEEEEEIIKQN